MENNYQSELDEQEREAEFNRQQALERIKRTKQAGTDKTRTSIAGAKNRLKDKVKARESKLNKLKQAKKSAKILLALIDIILAWGLDLTGWVVLFKQSLIVGTLCLAAYLIIIIGILILVVTVIMAAVCQATHSFLGWIVTLVTDKLDFCKAF